MLIIIFNTTGVPKDCIYSQGVFILNSGVRRDWTFKTCELLQSKVGEIMVFIC